MALTYSQQRVITTAGPDRSVVAYMMNGAFRVLVDNYAPEFTAVSPALASTLATSTTALVVRVRDYGIEHGSSNGTLKRALIWAAFGDGGAAELVFDGTSFQSPYSASSTSTPLSSPDGKEFSIVRTGGWRQNPTLHCYAIDPQANELNDSTTLAWVFTPTPASITPLVAVWDTSTSKLKIYFTGAPTTADTSKYDFTEPAGSSNLTVSSYTTSGNAVILTLSSTPDPSSYTVILSAGAATTAAGNASSGASLTFTGVDTIAPTVANPVPAELSELEPEDPIQFDVLDGHLGTVILFAKFPTLGKVEVLYYNDPDDGLMFGPEYDGTVSVISGGKRFSNVTRIKGWPAAPKIVIDPRDTAGN